MGLEDVFGKLEETLLNVLVRPLERPRGAYTPTSKSAVIRQRIETRIAALTPASAPVMPFVAQQGRIKASIAVSKRFRHFSVSVGNFGASDTGRGHNNAPYDLSTYIEIGYPDQPVVEVAGTFFDIDDLKSEDDELLDRLMRGGDLFTSPTAIADAQVVMLQGAYDVGNTIRRHNYQLKIKRTFT